MIFNIMIMKLMVIIPIKMKIIIAAIIKITITIK